MTTRAAHRLRLDLLPDRLAVCRLDPGAPLPDAALLPPAAPPPGATRLAAPARGGAIFSVTRTGEELSIVCNEDLAPPGSRVERGWRCLQVAGPLQFSLTGVLAALAVPLAERGVSIFALSTFDTDYLLVKSEQLETAAAALREAGHEVTMAAGENRE